MSENTFLRVKEELAKRGEYTAITSGKSMFPLFRNGTDIAVIKPPCFPLKKNTVALYRKDNVKELVLHRVIKVKGEEYIIRGDNTYFNETVKRADIIGVLDGFYRNGKYHNCKTDVSYKIYVFFTRLFYPVRFTFVAVRGKLFKMFKK